MCPDESAGIVNNSLWTNIIAKVSIENAMAVAVMLNEKPNPAYGKWLSRGPFLPYNDSLGIHLQYEGYTGEEINQDDACLLQYPLNVSMTLAQKRRDLDYYWPKTRSNGYFTGDSGYGVAFIRAGLLQQAENILWNATFAHIQG